MSRIIQTCESYEWKEWVWRKTKCRLESGKKLFPYWGNCRKLDPAAQTHGDDWNWAVDKTYRHVPHEKLHVGEMLWHLCLIVSVLSWHAACAALLFFLLPQNPASQAWEVGWCWTDHVSQSQWRLFVFSQRLWVSELTINGFVWYCTKDLGIKEYLSWPIPQDLYQVPF